MFVYAQTGPSFFGHSSGEIAFITAPSGSPGSAVLIEDCRFNDDLSCVVVCPPDPSSKSTYRAFTGACLSQSGMVWQSAGVTSDLKGWQCLDNSHTNGQIFEAHVFCVEVGI